MKTCTALLSARFLPILRTIPGKYLEVMAKRKTSQALVLLLKAQPNHAVLVEPGDVSHISPDSETRSAGLRERSVEVALVQPGDVLRVLPGAQASFVHA